MLIKKVRLLDKEVPHGVAVVTESMEESEFLTEIHAVIYTEKDVEATAEIVYDGGKITVKCREDSLSISAQKPFALEYSYAKLHVDEKVWQSDERTLSFIKRDYPYTLTLAKGKIKEGKAYSEEGEIRVNF